MCSNDLYLYCPKLKANIDKLSENNLTDCAEEFLGLEEMNADESFMKRLQAQLAFLKVKALTLMAYLNYFHVTQIHGKVEQLLYFLNLKRKLEEKGFEGEHTVTCNERKELVFLFSLAFTAAHSKLSKYVVDGAQSASKFLEQVQVLDPRNIIHVEHDLSLIDSIPGIEEVPKKE